MVFEFPWVVSMRVIWDTAVEQKIEFLALGVGLIQKVEVTSEPNELYSIRNEIFQEIKANTDIDEIKSSAIVKAY